MALLGQAPVSLAILPALAQQVVLTLDGYLGCHCILSPNASHDLSAVDRVLLLPPPRWAAGWSGLLSLPHSCSFSHPFLGYAMRHQRGHHRVNPSSRA
jgi:hypothetical protein